MTTYQVHPEPYYGIELRDGESINDYIAKARGFATTGDFIEYRDASPARKAEIRRARDDSADCGDEDRRRTYELLRLSK